MATAVTSAASAAQRVLTTGCHELLPSFVIPMFTSKTFIPLNNPPIPIWGALLPPLTYFLALFCLSAGPSASALTLGIKYTLATVSAISFLALPFSFHVPGSAVFTYQLGLIGCFGSARVIDLFFLSRPRIPKRIKVPQPDHQKQGLRRPHAGHEHKEIETHKGGAPVYPPGDNLGWAFEPHPTGLGSRLWWSLDLMISMRGIGWDFASADVRHDISPWQPPSSRQVNMAIFRLIPALGIAIIVTRSMLARLGGQPIESPLVHTSPSIVDLPAPLRPLLVLATGASLFTLFDAGYTLVSAAAMPILSSISNVRKRSLHNIDFYPLLNPLKLTEICSVRSFWSKAWHRLFHRAFLIYGILPFQNLALLLFPVKDVGLLAPSQHPDPARLLPKGTHDWAKVMGAFCASGMVHAISERAALGGRLALPPNNFWLQAGWATGGHAGSVMPDLASAKGLAGNDGGARWSFSRIVPPISGAGEFSFFFLNGVAVLIEGAVWAFVKERRRRAAMQRRTSGQDQQLQQQAEAVTSTGSSAPGTPRRRSARVAKAATAALDDSEDDVKHPGTPPVVTRSSASIDDAELTRWYDRYVGLIWAVSVLLTTGETFVDGWIKSGILAEISYFPH
ncbi:hypothetical protein BDZ90DRAFT_232386 [Jaminaea rosea]|uniref:Wax synthase domain-containing protein n=1 Tax=Jaminaea rosea TaxID=1569628 RepID=A0A316UQ46_9BASI|nr:hypothetical protein BDZ90DRAFT_232386 [Jaminaea rosea]PWN27410.1 hypothetical protein BDZ90DRAFT_232386 [Jaminaea rosea]